MFEPKQNCLLFQEGLVQFYTLLFSNNFENTHNILLYVDNMYVQITNRFLKNK